MNIKQAFQEFGLSEEEVKIYTSLTKGTWLTALQLARATSLNRTSLYRMLENLVSKGLVDKRPGDKTSYYQTTTPESFKSLILEKEDSIRRMQEAANSIAETVENMKRSNQTPKTIVNFYSNIRSLKNQEWKFSKIKNSEMLIFGADEWHTYMGEEFAEEVRERYVQNNIHIKELLNKSDEKDATEQEEWTKNESYLKIYEARYIDPTILNIQDEMYIINDSVVFYGLNETETVGIEIISPVYASMLRQLFYLTWNQAETLKIN